MAYEGRVRSRSGDLEGARAAYEKALALLEPVSGNELRITELRKEMEGITAASP
jgi:hypothetical protein